MERRDFLQLLGGTSIALLTGCAASNIQQASEQREIPEIQVIASPTINLRQLTHEEETIHYRRRLGLTDSSSELLWAQNKNSHEWDTTWRPYQNNFPQFLKSYGVYGSYSREAMLGRSGGYLVYGGEVHPNPLEYAFDTERKFIRLATTVGRDYWTKPTPKGWTIQGLYAHEKAHATHTILLADVLPLDTFKKVEHGTYRMVAQHDQVKGDFAEKNANWKTKERLPRELGATMAREYLVDKSRVDNEGIRDHLEQAATELSQELKISRDQLRFNKKNSLLFGRKILDKVETGQFNLASDHQQEYNRIFEESLYEVYAEMFRALLTDPRLIQHNPEIIAGGQEILSALRGDQVSLDTIRTNTNTVPNEIHQLWLQERAAYPVIPTQIINPKEAKIETVFREILNKGIRAIPKDLGIFKDELGIFVDFIDRWQRVCWKYSELSRIDERWHWYTFDPNLHLWEIDEIHAATDPSVIRNFLKIQFEEISAVKIRNEYKERFITNTAILDKFIKSDAFDSVATSSESNKCCILT